MVGGALADMFDARERGTLDRSLRLDLASTRLTRSLLLPFFRDRSHCGCFLQCAAVQTTPTPVRAESDRAISPLFSAGLAIVAGPTVSPVIGSAVTNSYLGWRWTEVSPAVRPSLFRCRCADSRKREAALALSAPTLH